MKKFLMATFVTVLVASPAFARTARRAVMLPPDAYAQVGVVIESGQYIGQDPDANVETQLRRDAGQSIGAY